MPRVLNSDFLDFWRERHLCTMTTLRPDGSLHVAPVGVTLDEQGWCAWVISSATSKKVRNVRSAGPGGAPVAVCQVDGRRWCTLEGVAEVRDDEESVREAVERYARRYRAPRPNPERVAIRLAITRVLGNVPATF
jgi:F420H(2)-dependent biliverdin reductase